MKTVLRIALAALAIAGFVTVETPDQPMPVQTALVEFGLPGQWAAPSCASPLSCSRSRAGPTSQFVIRRDKDGVRFDITGATKLQNDLATLQLRPNAVFKGDTWQAASAADALPSTRPSSLHALCFVEQQSASFITMNTTACCSPSHAAQLANSVAL